MNSGCGFALLFSVFVWTVVILSVTLFVMGRG